MTRLAVLFFALALSGCGYTGGGDLKGLADDPHSGCAGISASIYGGGWILHIGAGTGDSGTVDMNHCSITAAGAANPSINPVAGIPAGATMTITTPAIKPAPVVVAPLPAPAPAKPQ